ncbi:unnamed protein product [Notodromas monacha]|uniref:Small lysine-rich protein 1 n=1 Tax=Notodromas monacha TaxID=399045 RepID=A0A7R9GD16_9CRUS|nr:unnamed protein product [Notodromas monacha]CAG0916514.1 unnamed protein product [Notodromas monacha]
MHQSPAVKQQKEPGFAEKAAKLEEKKQAQQQEVIDAPSGSDPSKLTPTAKPKQKKSKGGAGGNKKSGGAERRGKLDILSPIAMENAYYTCHNVPMLLQSRDFTWSIAAKGKKGKKKRKRG